VLAWHEGRLVVPALDFRACTHTRMHTRLFAAMVSRTQHLYSHTPVLTPAELSSEDSAQGSSSVSACAGWSSVGATHGAVIAPWVGGRHLCRSSRATASPSPPQPVPAAHTSRGMMAPTLAGAVSWLSLNPDSGLWSRPRLQRPAAHRPPPRACSPGPQPLSGP